MRKGVICLGLVLLGAVLPAQVLTGFEAVTDQGRLGSFEGWWQGNEDWEGHWWWSESTGGSAWLRAAALLVGPLVVSEGTAGQRTWMPRSDLSSGHWGVGLDLDWLGIWAVQGTQKLEAGVQGRFQEPAWALAGGVDRTWSLCLPSPDKSPWVDRARLGLDLDLGPWDSELELSASLPAFGPCSGKIGAKDAWAGQDWSLGGRAAFEWQQGNSDLQGWTTRLDADAGPWGVTLETDQEEHVLRGEARWEGETGLLSLGFGVDGSWAAQVEARAEVWATKLGVRVCAEGQGERQRWGTRCQASAQLNGGRWSCSWEQQPWGESVKQVVAATWKQAGFETETRWSTLGWRLGWLGPGSEFRLTLRYWIEE